jgi:integrase
LADIGTGRLDVSLDRLQALLTVAVSLGLRQGEALGLRWRDVGFEKGTLRVGYALQKLKARKTSESEKVSSTFHLVEPKTKQSRRTVSLPAATLSSLLAHKAHQAEERALAGSGWQTPTLICDGERTLGGRSGLCYDRRCAFRRFGDYAPVSSLTVAKIGHHRCHDLRHTSATLLAIQGVHPRAIQAALGWESASILTRYAHLADEARAFVATAIEAILNPVAVNLAVKPADTSKTAKPN